MKHQKETLFIPLIMFLMVGFLAVFFFPAAQAPSPPLRAAFDPLNATYLIEGQSVSLVNGMAQTPAAPGSASFITTRVFGVPVHGDLNGDGMPDAALLITRDSGGSGTFFYAAVALNVAGGAEGTNAVLLGDRIAPQNIGIKNGQMIANYAEREPGQPMTARPSVGVSRYMVVSGSTLHVSNAIVGPGERCGGNMTTAPTCIAGYHCAPAPGSHLPFGDVGGTCIAD